MCEYFKIIELNKDIILVISQINKSSTSFLSEITKLLNKKNYKIILFDDYIVKDKRNRFYKYANNILSPIKLPETCGIGIKVRNITNSVFKDVAKLNLQKNLKYLI